MTKRRGGLNLGVFGGTFDPPHTGHLILAMQALEQLELDQVLWVLTPDPPHKTGRRITPATIRAELVLRAIAGEKRFQLSQVDLERPAPHYAIDTLRLLSMSNPGSRLLYLMGGDSLRDILTWHQPQAFIEACSALGVMRRSRNRASLEVIEERIPELAGKLNWIEAPRIDISSTMVRDRCRNGLSYRYFVPEAVYAYIEDSGLYK